MCAKREVKPKKSEEIAEKLQGYKGYAFKKLEAAGAKVWDVVELVKDKRTIKGIILPRAQLEEETNNVTLKLKNGYNVGIELTDATQITVFSQEVGEYKLPEKEVAFIEKLPTIALLGTGGTIAARLDYRTGAVYPAFSPAELFTAIPELANLCNLKPEVIFKILSEDMNPNYWLELATTIYNKIKSEEVDGVVVGHGTDTMCFTGTALSFLLQDLPVPVILVGSQRSSDRPSSDSATNLINAVTCAAQGDFAEVLILMMGSTDHDYSLLHRPALARKMHSSRRDAFKTIKTLPFGKVKEGTITCFENDYRKRDKSREIKPDLKLDPKVALVYHYPGIQADVIDNLIDKKYHGIVIAGTGLGHISKNLLDPLKRAIEEKIAVIMTVQTLWGFTGMQVYQRGREELTIGVIPGHSMLPETAYVKLCWVLGHTRNLDEVKERMLTNIAGELINREPPHGYLIFQGVEPKFEDYFKQLK